MVTSTTTVVDFVATRTASRQGERIEYDPNRTAHIALVCYADGERRYIIAPRNLEVGAPVSGFRARSAGNTLPIRNIPVGSTIHCIELKPGAGAQIARSAGASVHAAGPRRHLRPGAYAFRRSAQDPHRMPRHHGEVANEDTACANWARPV